MNIALIEFNKFHDECLFSQLSFIRTRPQTKVFLIYNHNLKRRIGFWDQLDGSLSVSSNQWVVGHLRILNFLNKNNVDTVIFNSLHYKQISAFLNFSSSKKRKHFGIVHDLKDLESKQTKMILEKISGYFVLNDYLLENVNRYGIEKAKFQSFYPIYFEELVTKTLIKDEEEIWVAIPGLLESSRRDYKRLVDSIRSQGLSTNIKILFLGSSLPHFEESVVIRKDLEELDSHKQFVFWDDFVDNDTFQSYLLKSDYLLPLIHNQSASGSRYREKITGLFNLAFGYGIRLVLDNFFREFEDFRSTAVFYSQEDDLVNVLNHLDKPKLTQKVYSDDKFRLGNQAKKYLRFIEEQD